MVDGGCVLWESEFYVKRWEAQKQEVWFD